jgi:hypothetical protein
LVIVFTDHLQIVTAGNYNAISNLHALQFTETQHKSAQFVFISRCLAIDPTMTSSAMSLPAADCLAPNIPHNLNCLSCVVRACSVASGLTQQKTLFPAVLYCGVMRSLRRKRAYRAMETCLVGRCLAADGFSG